MAVAFPSGYGDGGYVSYLGSDGEGPVALVTDFGVLYESTQLTMRFEGVRGLRRGALRHSLIDDANIDVTFENFASRLELHFEGRGDPNDSLPFKPDGIPWLIDDNGRHGKRARSPGTSANTEHFSLDLWSTVADDAVLEITLSCGRIPLSCR